MPLGICYNVNKFIINKTYVFSSNLCSLDFLRGFMIFLIIMKFKLTILISILHNHYAANYNRKLYLI